MAEDKKGFILYADLIHTVKKMSSESRGDLFLTILEYVNDMDPTVDDMVVDLVFEPIKQQLKRDLKHWESKREKRAKAGKKGGLAKASNAKQSKANLAVIVNGNVNATVTDTVNVKANVKEKDKRKKTNTEAEQKSSLHTDMISLFDKFYKERTEEKFTWDAKQATNIKHLKKKIVQKLREKVIIETDEKILESFNVILNRIQDKWILDNLTPATINSKFNEIIQNGREGKTTRVTTKTIRDFLDADM